MNNEDKILKLLENLTEDVGELKGSVEQIDKRLASVEVNVEQIDKRLASVEANAERVDDRLTSIESDVKATRHAVEGIDINFCKIWSHLIRQDGNLIKLEDQRKEM